MPHTPSDTASTPLRLPPVTASPDTHPEPQPEQLPVRPAWSSRSWRRPGSSRPICPPSSCPHLGQPLPPRPPPHSQCQPAASAVRGNGHGRTSLPPGSTLPPAPVTAPRLCPVALRSPLQSSKPPGRPAHQNEQSLAYVSLPWSLDLRSVMEDSAQNKLQVPHPRMAHHPGKTSTRMRSSTFLTCADYRILDFSLIMSPSTANLPYP